MLQELRSEGFNTAYGVALIFRMFGEDVSKMKEFHDEYAAVRKIQYTEHIAEPSIQDFEWAKRWIEGESKSQIAYSCNDEKIKAATIEAALRRVGKWQLKQKGL